MSWLLRNAASLCLCWGLLLVSLGWSLAEDWPQFRGPDGQGHASNRPVAVAWSETENVLWKTPIPGRGWSSPVVLGETIWMTTAVDEGHSLRVVAVDRDSGSLLHDIEVFRVSQPPRINPKNSYASPTPIIEPGRLYVHFGTMGTACLDTDTGKILWTNHELRIEHKEGPGSSPILWRDFLIVNCDGMDFQYVAALDKHTGAIAWRTARSGPLNVDPDQHKAYSTPLVIRVNDAEQLVSPGADWTIAYDPLTGGELWKIHYEGYSSVPRPVFNHGLLYTVTGFTRPELIAVRPALRGEVTDTNIVWRHAKQVPANPSPIVVDQEIYFVSDGGVGACLDALTGEELWRERMPGKFWASPIVAGGKLYFAAEEGNTFVLQPGRTYRLLATNPLDGQLMASPVAVDGALFLRSDSHLYRIQPAIRQATRAARQQ